MITELGWVPIACVTLAAIVGAVTDIWKFRVYNALTIPLFLTGLGYHAMMGGREGFANSAMGALFGFVVLIVPYALGLMGAGDVKLLAGVGAWLCYPVTVTVFVISSLVAGVYALALILLRGKISESVLTTKVILYKVAALGAHFGKDDLVEELAVAPDRRLRVIPFGAMIPFGIIGALWWLNMMH